MAVFLHSLILLNFSLFEEGVAQPFWTTPEESEKQEIASAYSLGSPCFSEEPVLIGFSKRTDSNFYFLPDLVSALLLGL
jgi:hypothetical protein